ncbi:enoyl-CoA hydratase/isomerase family protein [Paenalcaligenes niemegkensis]|uniref:enoyl-CoA hydratase/isomerase family protein n=1 Tax=Paenalcaligenes niemegkensis TaxID=2895469 RepID=UPI001EE80070|nr:enoyl-CoA hydratase/isomerase family protein [Paenalcaligenes niemegkensis]MCQ9615725.1 enoyl-CoA hydratase/isomerase family protein [Paenalcaligenes niemegkensis]
MLVQTTRTADGSIVCISLDRPRYANALNSDLVESLITALDEAFNSPARLIVFKGSGNSFCGGFDLREIESETDATLAYRFLRLELLLQKVHYAPIYTLALAHGAVTGAGADLVAACKKRVVISDATFRFPGVRFGVLLGTNRLRDIISQKAYAILLEQQKLELNEAIACGFIHTLIDPKQQEELISALCKKVSGVSPETMASILQLDRQQGVTDMGLLATSVATPDFRQRVQKYWLEAKSIANNRK